MAMETGKKNTKITTDKKPWQIGRKLFAGIAVAALFLNQISFSFAEENQDSYEKVIAHGGGAYKGYETSNSVDAVKNSIKNGYKMIELDMDISSDNHIVMIHDWDRTTKNYFGTTFEKKITQKKFLKLTVYEKFEVLTFEKLAEILKENKEIRIITDTKGNNLELLTKIAEEYPDMVSRIIPQIYDYDQFDKVKALGYSDIIFTLYAMAEIDTAKLTTFVIENGIYAVAMPDYLAERGYCSKVAKAGVKVYVHPVSDFENAQDYMKLGAYGVYSGNLLPEEFSGLEKDCYLAVNNGNGTMKKLSDSRVDGLQELLVHGLKTGESASYYLDGSVQSCNQEMLSALEDGKHKLTVKISAQGKLLGSLDYFLWKDAGNYRVVHKKYEYRLDTAEQRKDFSSIMEENKVPEKIAELLEHSIVAKNGEHAYYANGVAENYMNGEEFLPVQKNYGKLMLPLSTTLKQLGAESVSMGNTKDITVQFRNEKYMVMADTCLIRKGFIITRINMPVVLYLGRAMAGGEAIRIITGREYLEKDDLIILLPEGATTDTGLNAELIKAAGLLY